jgi:hypothetical protein
MATADEPTLLGQLCAKVAPTVLTEGASETERIHAPVAFLSGANALVATTRADQHGGSEAVMEALRGLHADLQREAGSRQVRPRMQ